LYLNGIDTDNLKAIEEICARGGRSISLNEFAEWTLVEQHSDDTNRAHTYVYSHKPFAKKSSDKNNNNNYVSAKLDTDAIPSIEVKGLGEHGILFCSPSIHKKGQPYQIIGTKEPAIADDFEEHIDKICRKYGLRYLDNNGSGNGQSQPHEMPIKELFHPSVKVLEGERAVKILRIMDSLLRRNARILSLEQIHTLAYNWNKEHCDPPLDDLEFEHQWNTATKFILGQIKAEEDKQKEEKDEDDKQENRRNATKALAALEVIRSRCSELFVDQIGEPYAAIEVRDHIETIAIRTNRFKEWIIKAYYDYRKEQHEKLLEYGEEFNGKEEYNNAIDGTTSSSSVSSSPLLSSEDAAKIQTIIKLEAEDLQNERKLEVRVAGNVDSDRDTNDDDNIIWYDLTNRDWEIVKITKHGWHIEKHGSHSSSSALPIILFKRYRNQLPQVYPSRKYPPDIFSQFMDLTNLPTDDKENRILGEVYTIALFIPPDIPKTVLIPHGEQGAAKSTFQEFIKSLVDPCGALTLSFPKEPEEIVQQLSHNYIAYYDNVSEIPQWISDVLCRAVTGSGFSKRILYSDDDDFIYRFRRCVGFNGINVAATRPDLLERSLILHLKGIPEEKKRKLKHLWKQYEKIKPQVLGFIFNTLVQVLNRLKEVQLKKYPRMADWAEVCEVISRCLGYPENAFLDAYYKNMTRQNEHALEASPIATAIIKLMEQQDYWKGSASQLLEELKHIADGMSINTKMNLWPKAPNALSRKLNEVRTNLSKVGIEIERPIDTVTNTRLVEIRKISPQHPVSPEDLNQAQLELENPGDITGDTDSISPDISPAANTENHAQNKQSGDNGYTGDILHTSLPIHRLGRSDTWACRDCKQKGDRHFMKVHNCSGVNRKSCRGVVSW
jgi:hypothetical protein